MKNEIEIHRHGSESTVTPCEATEGRVCDPSEQVEQRPQRETDASRSHRAGDKERGGAEENDGREDEAGESLYSVSEIGQTQTPAVRAFSGDSGVVRFAYLIFRIVSYCKK